MLDDPDNEALKRLQRMAQRIFEITSAHQGHATIEYCPTALKSKLNIWSDPGPDFPLLRKVKSIFDPAGVFSPGRFVGGL